MLLSPVWTASAEDGVYLRELFEGEEIEVETESRSYRLVNCGQDQAFISGHPRYCPQPTLVDINGSTWGGSMLKMGFIGRGMHLEFRLPDRHAVLTSRIVAIRRVREKEHSETLAA